MVFGVALMTDLQRDKNSQPCIPGHLQPLLYIDQFANESFLDLKLRHTWKNLWIFNHVLALVELIMLGGLFADNCMCCCM